MVFERTKIYEEAELPMIVIYENPTDFPGKFVARLWDMIWPTDLHVVKDTYEELLEEIPDFMVKIQRLPFDDPVIKEVWM